MRFLENAREGKNHWLRYLALLAASYTIMSIASFIVFIPLILFSMDLRLSYDGWQTLPGAAATLLSIAIWGLLVWLLLKPFHKRSRATLISGAKKFRTGLYMKGVLACGAILLASCAPTLISGECTFNFEGSKFFAMTAICLLLVPLQAASEEIVFRGYVLQGFALCTKSKAWALAISSVLFGLMHCANVEVSAYGFAEMMPLYIMMGAQLAFFAIVTDGMEFPAGMHFINNFLGCVLIGDSNGTLNVCPLFTIESDGVGVMDYLMPVIETAAIYLILRKKMGWNLKEAFSSSGLRQDCGPGVPPPLPEQPAKEALQDDRAPCSGENAGNV